MKKKFLITSILSIVMCMSLIAGATFALFTSESNVNIAVTSGTVNVSANAEVVATYSAVGKDVTTYTDAEKTATLGIFENNGTAKVEDGKVILDRMTPGDRVDVKITVDNNSDVNVKHRTVISAYNDTGLFKGLKFIIAQGSQAVNFGGNVGVYYGMYNTALATDGVGADIDDITVSIALPDNGMSGVDNEYQNTACEINFKIEAVQGNADVETVTGLKDTDGDGYLEINNKEELVFFAAQVNGGSMITNNVELMANIDLGKMPWTPIGPDADVAGTRFSGIFEGNGYTISNLYVNQGAAYHAAGLFGALSGTAKNFTVDGAYINSISSGSVSNNGNAVVAGSLYNRGNVDNVAVKNAKVYANRYVGGIAGYAYGNVTNCTVEDIELVSTPDKLSGEYDNGDKVGGIAGYYSAESTYKFENNDVKNATLTGYRDIGGAIGCANAATVKDCDVQDITIIIDRTNFYGYKDSNVGAIVGRKTNCSDDMQINCTGIIKNLTHNSVVNAEFNNIIRQNAKVINIALIENVTFNTNSSDTADAKWGGVDTDNVTVNGNGYKLTGNTPYWSYVNMYNTQGVVTIKNATITSSQATGTWNSYDFAFSCNVVLDNVVSEKSIALDLSSEKTAVLKNVTINENHDYYALWIVSEGASVTVENLTVNCAGRGIKIDEEYANDNDVKKVTLTIKGNNAFTTNSKAAIIVKSKSGADIIVESGASIDISKVQADTTNLVWVDEDSAAYFDLVTVSSGYTKVQE